MATSKIINGVKFSTETATPVASSDNGCWGDFNQCSETLYRKRTGEYFLHGDGGALSRYSRSYGGCRVGGQDIVPLTEKDARKWAEEHLSGDEYEEIFGVVEEDGSQATITVSISAEAMDCGQRAADRRGMSLPALIDKLLRNA